MALKRAKQKLTLILIRDPHQPVRRLRMTRWLIYGFILHSACLVLVIAIWQYSLHRNSSETIDTLSSQLATTAVHYDALLDTKQSVIDDLRAEIIQMNDQTEQIRHQLDQLILLEREIGELLPEAAVDTDAKAEDRTDFRADVQADVGSLFAEVGSPFAAAGRASIGGTEHAVSDEQWDEYMRDARINIALMRAEMERLSGKLLMTREQLRLKIEQIRAIPDYWPTRSRQITSGYGVRRDPFTGKSAFHYGIDIAGNSGDAVLAAADGMVVETGSDASQGNYVTLAHRNGIRTVYMHLSRIIVDADERVEKGEKIGTIGSTGRSTGPHLHFEIIDNGRHVDPLQYLRE